MSVRPCARPKTVFFITLSPFNIFMQLQTSVKIKLSLSNLPLTLFPPSWGEAMAQGQARGRPIKGGSKKNKHNYKTNSKNRRSCNRNDHSMKKKKHSSKEELKVASRRMTHHGILSWKFALIMRVWLILNLIMKS